MILRRDFVKRKIVNQLRINKYKVPKFWYIFSDRVNQKYGTKIAKLQCFRQAAPLREFRVAFREGPQKNEERANLALHFYKPACRLNLGIVL